MGLHMKKNLPNSTINYFYKSNILIHAVSDLPLFEKKILTLAFINIQKEHGTLKSTLTAAYMKSMLKLSARGGGFYKNLYNASLAITKRQMLIPEENGNFMIINIITDATYDHGILDITWNSSLEKYLYNPSVNTTLLNIHAVMSFKSIYSLRLYETVMSCIDDTALAKEYHLIYTVPELRSTLGIANPDDIQIHNLFFNDVKGNCIADDHLQVQDLLPKVGHIKFPSFREFNRAVITKAKNEINTCDFSDILISSHNISKGKGGKIEKIEFIIRKVKKVSPLA